MTKSCIALIMSASLGLSVATALYAETPANEPPQKMEAKREAKLREVDTDGDGAISKQEFLTKAEKRFAKMDTNGDGKISSEERAATRQKMKEMRQKRQEIKKTGGEAVPSHHPVP